jgi:hypothetical protein
MFERFTEAARRLLFFARYEVSLLGAPQICPEHLLLGLIREPAGLTARILAQAHVSLESIRREIEGSAVRGEHVSTSVEVPFSDDAQHVLRTAADEADKLLHNYVDTAHLLLALVLVEGTTAAATLTRLGLRADTVRGGIADLSGGGGVSAILGPGGTAIDHLVYGTTDLARGIAEVEALLGVTPTAGGPHPGRGTRNAVVSLGRAVYLEIIGPDPAQPTPARPRMFELDTLESPRLITWAARATDLARRHALAHRRGVPLGDVGSGSRDQPGGPLLSWQFTDPSTLIADGIVPFFIDWGSSPHPAAMSARGAALVDLRAEHPDPTRVQQMLQSLELALPVTAGPRPALVATIDSPRGRVELR